MSGRWWRAYSRARHDPKLLKLSDKHFRWWFNLVCVASENGGTLPPHADLAVEFRVSGKVITDILDALVASSLLDHTDAGIRPHNWNVLQYVSDSSSNRVKQFRERHRNVSVTPSETEAETEADTEIRGSITTTPSVANSAPAGASHTARSELITEKWEPSETDKTEIIKQIPWLANADLYAKRMADFRDWCVANATRSFNPAATWRGFMRKTPEPRASFGGPKINGQAVTQARTDEPWEWRVSNFRKDGFWQPTWGPPPGSPGCFAPKEFLQ